MRLVFFYIWPFPPLVFFGRRKILPNRLHVRYYLVPSHRAQNLETDASITRAPLVGQFARARKGYSCRAWNDVKSSRELRRQPASPVRDLGYSRLARIRSPRRSRPLPCQFADWRIEAEDLSNQFYSPVREL